MTTDSFTGMQLIIAEWGEPPWLEPVPRLLDITDDPWIVGQTATAWAEVHGYESIIPAIKRTVPPSPDTGFSVVVNRPHQLIIYARWAWADTGVMAELHLI
jgi:hypothetical protein